MSSSDHPPRSIVLYRAQQIGALFIVALMILAILGLVVLSVILAAPLLGLMAFVLGLLLLPVFMQLSVAPPLRVNGDGIEIHPLVWHTQTIAWVEIEAVLPHGLLPTSDQEVFKRVLQGRNNFEAAAGVMLRVPHLPWQYRIVGFFVGQPGQALIAVTNRSHRDYWYFLDQVERYAPHLLKQKVDA